MELKDIFYNKQDFVETASGNKVSRSTVLCGSQNIVINGKSIVRDGVIIRGDLASVRIGRQCIIDRHVTVRPPFKKFSKGIPWDLNATPPSTLSPVLGLEQISSNPYTIQNTVAFFPLHIGDNVFIGEGSVVNAAVIGSYVYIGKNCIIGRRCVLKDCCMVADNTVLSPETVVPSFAVYTGSPGLHTRDQPDCTQDLMIEFTKSYYQHFLPNTAPPSTAIFSAGLLSGSGAVASMS